MDLESNLNSESVELAKPRPPLLVEPDASVNEVMRLLRQEQRGCALVCLNGVLQGIFAERDALRVMAAGGPYDVPVKDAMWRLNVTIKSSDSMASAIRKLSFSGHRRLPILDIHNRPTGVLKISGVLHYLVQYVSKAVYTLPPRPHALMQEREGA